MKRVYEYNGGNEIYDMMYEISDSDQAIKEMKKNPDAKIYIDNELMEHLKKLNGIVSNEYGVVELGGDLEGNVFYGRNINTDKPYWRKQFFQPRYFCEFQENSFYFKASQFFFSLNTKSREEDFKEIESGYYDGNIGNLIASINEHYKTCFMNEV